MKMMMIITCVMIMMMKLMTIKIVAIYNYDENDDDNPQGEAALCLHPHSDHACQPQVNHHSHRVDHHFHHDDHHFHCVDHHFHSKLTILFESSESFFPVEQTILPPSSSPTRTWSSGRCSIQLKCWPTTCCAMQTLNLNWQNPPQEEASGTEWPNYKTVLMDVPCSGETKLEMFNKVPTYLLIPQINLYWNLL